MLPKLNDIDIINLSSTLDPLSLSRFPIHELGALIVCFWTSTVSSGGHEIADSLLEVAERTSGPMIPRAVIETCLCSLCASPDDVSVVRSMLDRFFQPGMAVGAGGLLVKDVTANTSLTYSSISGAKFERTSYW